MAWERGLPILWRRSKRVAMAAFGESCRRCGHVLTARFDPLRKTTVHRSNRENVDFSGGRGAIVAYRDRSQKARNPYD
jgi:hypothetical protein